MVWDAMRSTSSAGCTVQLENKREPLVPVFTSDTGKVKTPKTPTTVWHSLTERDYR